MNSSKLKVPFVRKDLAYKVLFGNGSMDLSKLRVPLMPLEEIKEELKQKMETGSSNREKILENVSEKYIREHADCLNEVCSIDCRKTIVYRKTVLVSYIEETKFNIIVYSGEDLSKLTIYAISSSYQSARSPNKPPMKSDFLVAMRWLYPEIQDFETRMHLYEYVEDGLIIVLDFEPEKLGFDPKIMKMTKTFNSAQSDGKFKTVIKYCIDFDIVVTSAFPLSLEDVKNIGQSYAQAQNFVSKWEDSGRFDAFLNSLLKTITGYRGKINLYEYHNSFLEIGIE